MLTPLLAHSGQPLEPHDLWGAWNVEPALLLGLLLLGAAYQRGRTRGARTRAAAWRGRCFVAGLAALVLALVSPLDALAGALASAHMVQHVLILLVAAPLLALSAPSSTLLRGSPLAVRRASGRWRRRLGLTPRNLRMLRHPIAISLLHVTTVWFWHAAVPYDAALDHAPIHVLEHVSFLVTAWLFWQVVIGARAGAGRVSRGFAVLLIFGMAMQSVLLSALLTFSQAPWYSGYETSTAAWGLESLTDQQLAGVILWIPAAPVYLVIALSLVVSWLQASEREASTP